MRRELRPLAALAAVLLGALAGGIGPALASDGDWQEADTPAPPQLNLRRAIPLDLAGSSLRFSVQPDSVSIGPDRVVRYVVLATSSSGALNAMYEGLRCVTGEVKVYARYQPGSGWTPVERPEWQSVHGNPAQRHSLAIARTGACQGRGANYTAAQIVRDLAAPVDDRFGSEQR